VAEYRRCLADFFAEGVQDGLRLAYVSSDGVEAAGADLADLGDLERLLAVRTARLVGPGRSGGYCPAFGQLTAGLSSSTWPASSTSTIGCC
jgi:hypothetical protein